MYIFKVIIHIEKLSNLSKNPPWPGSKLLEFFNKDFLLKYDSKISPKKDDKIIRNINIIDSNKPKILKWKLYKNEQKKVIKKPEKNPKKVLFGLIFGNIFLTPNLAPKK